MWWFRRPDRHRVIDAYIDQCKRGRALPERFKDDLVQWLEDLSHLQNKKAWGQPRTYRHWSVPAYALAHGMKSGALMKRIREMEKIAKQLMPDSVPASRKTRGPLTEEDKQQIRKLYLGGVDAKELAQQFRIPASRVGHICRQEKTLRQAERERLKDEHIATIESKTVAPGTADDLDSPFGD